ncbi:MAG TPA: hypothetical protein DCE44_00795, partial [Verrucomicrobiales bacterium]|nr:hypothetical protein [Verrucomicrobiales bacterium]
FDLLVDRTGPGLPRLSQQELRRIVDKLKQLAPELASTHGYRSILAYADLDFAEAEKQALKAIAADPAADREAWYGFLLTHWGRAEEARQRLKNARAFESSGGFIYRVMGHSYYAERDFTNAIAWYRQAINWEPLQASAIGFLGEAYQAMGDYTNSFDHLAKAQILYGADPAQTQTEFDQYRRAFAEGGVRGYWEERQKQVDQRSNLNPYDRAVIQIHLGETNAALDSLYQYYEQREQRERRGAENKLGYLLFHECWDGIRGDRRFRELLDKVGYTSVMKPSKN